MENLESNMQEEKKNPKNEVDANRWGGNTKKKVWLKKCPHFPLWPFFTFLLFR